MRMPTTTSEQNAVRRRVMWACGTAAASGVLFWCIAAFHALIFAWMTGDIVRRFARDAFATGERWVSGPWVGVLVCLFLAGLLPYAFLRAYGSRTEAREALAFCIPASMVPMLILAMFGGAPLFAGYGLHRPEYAEVLAFVSAIHPAATSLLPSLLWTTGMIHVLSCAAAFAACRSGDDGEDLRIRLEIMGKRSI
jgi:hypothetical protein